MGHGGSRRQASGFGISGWFRCLGVLGGLGCRGFGIWRFWGFRVQRVWVRVSGGVVDGGDL